MPIIHRLHWDRQEIVNSTGGAIANRAEYPNIFTGVAEKIIAIQLVQDDENGDLISYTGIESGGTCNFRVDNDYENGVGSVGSSDWALVSGVEYKKEIGTEPSVVYINSVSATEGTIGSLSAGEWAFSGRYLYVRLDDDADPSTKPDNYVQIAFGTGTGTPPYIQAESDVWNLAGTWPVYNSTTNAWTYTDPDITLGQITFKIAANTFDYVARIGATAQQDCHGQIGFFTAGDDSNYITFFNQFNCINVIDPEEPPVIVPSPYLTVTLGDARYVRFGEAGRYIETFSSTDLTGTEITITHDMSTTTPICYLIQSDGKSTGQVEYTVVDLNNVTLDFENWAPFTDMQVVVSGGAYVSPDAIPLTQKGVANGVATLGSDTLIPDAQTPEIAVKVKGNWDADANTPSLSDASGSKGELYFVSVNGARDLGSGFAVYYIGEAIVHDGSAFQKIGEELIPPTRITATYTILPSDKYIVGSTAGGDLNLPEGEDGRPLRIANTSDLDMPIVPYGTDLLDGENETKTLPPHSVIDIQFQTTEGWW